MLVPLLQLPQKGERVDRTPNSLILQFMANGKKQTKEL